MRMSIIGFNPPGKEFCRPDGSPMVNVHVGVQRRRDPDALVRADSTDARWDVDVDVVGDDADIDFRGPVVQGKRGDRFVYLIWGEVHSGGEFEMFRRAKLMLNRIDRDVLARARVVDHIAVRVDMTGDDGGPRCARVDPPAIEWSVPGAADAGSG
ncbi:MAG: DUF5990 family protein [Ilumatobacter sp.]|uniref:DUF5990 family protein n=1 Tax=Ilumatobacter sp. TaxID=1967498 RepID=UPI0026180E1E|nr:DUF5990 family protein [Ilumatobacter sp.]MDJ0768169.1 DUF5990 family protein [Ilumatobacter sp.]